MKYCAFNPFEDRFSRDLRNALSSGFADAVETGSMDKFESTLKKFAAMDLAPHYAEYFEDRCDRYKCVLELVSTNQNPLLQAAILWNHGLYFEVHEVLEHSWYHARGDEKLTMQALIRAAGAYVKRASGYTEPAKKIAAKAWPVIEKNKDLLSPYFDPEALIIALKDENASPPKLLLRL